MDFLADLFSLSWLAGPIFEKELRVSSRRKRNYVLRFVYLASLTAFISFIWYTMVRISGGTGSNVVQLSMMSEAGKYIVTTIIWFQFIAVQFVSVVMLSTSISDEIRHRTLGMLMTTPVSSFQIVTGKFLSKLLQLILLLAISLPLLTIVRVFGGVPWDFVLSSLCITLTAAFFAGSSSLLFSIFNRRANTVVIKVILVCFLFYFIPFIVLRLIQMVYPGVAIFIPYLYYVNPFIALGAATERTLSASAAVPAPMWGLHCGIMLCASIFLLAISTVYVRKVGLQQVAGQAGVFGTWKERRAAKGERKAVSKADSGSIRRIKGPLLLWKEMMGMYNRWGLKTAAGILLVGAILTVVYVFYVYRQLFDKIWVHIGFVCVYFFLSLLQISSSAASSITNEKEARTWPILLTVPLTNKQIAFGKILGSCIRGWFFLLCLIAHVAVFSIAGYIHPAAILPLILLVAASMFLVSSAGVFFSSCFKHGSVASTVNMILFLGFMLPLCCPSYIVSPLFAAGIILSVTSGWEDFTVPLQNTGSPWLAWLGTFLVSYLALFVLVAIYLLMAFVAFAFASSNIRRRIF